MLLRSHGCGSGHTSLMRPSLQTSPLCHDVGTRRTLDRTWRNLAETWRDQGPTMLQRPQRRASQGKVHACGLRAHVRSLAAWGATLCGQSGSIALRWCTGLCTTPVRVAPRWCRSCAGRAPSELSSLRAARVETRAAEAGGAVSSPPPSGPAMTQEPLTQARMSRNPPPAPGPTQRPAGRWTPRCARSARECKSRTLGGTKRLCPYRSPGAPRGRPHSRAKSCARRSCRCPNMGCLFPWPHARPCMIRV